MLRDRNLSYRVSVLLKRDPKVIYLVVVFALVAFAFIFLQTIRLASSYDEETSVTPERSRSLLETVEQIRRFDFIPQRDHIYFFHIPKTAGSAFSELLRFLKHCPQPGGCGQRVLPDGTPDFNNVVNGMEADCCCIHTCIGHFHISDIGNVRHKIGEDKKLYTVTILRDPAGRVASEYWYLAEIIPKGLKPQFLPFKQYHYFKEEGMSITKYTTIDDFDTETECCGTVNNRQVMMLAGVDIEAKGTMGDARVLELAKQNLLTLDYFGVSDRWQDSIELLIWTFGQSHMNYVPANATWSRVNPHPHPDQTELDTILKRNSMEAELYKFSQKVFDERFKAMKYHKAQQKLQQPNP